MNKWAKIGAVCYVLWGVLHINAARLVYALGQSVHHRKHDQIKPVAHTTVFPVVEYCYDDTRNGKEQEMPGILNKASLNHSRFDRLTQSVNETRCVDM